MRSTNAEELLKIMIDIPSVTRTEQEMGNFLMNHLQRQGFAAAKIPTDEGRFNVFATSGKPNIIFQAHIDTVPPFISATENERFIFGRGACDTKGSIAAMLVAAEQAKRSGVQNFGLLFTVDEEADFAGAKKVQSIVKDSKAFLIVGEPTKLKAVVAHFGILTLVLTCNGKNAHSSEPQLGVNAIDKLVTILATKVPTLQIKKGTLMSIVRVTGGVADNIIPDKAEALLSFRIAPTDETDYSTELQRIVGSACHVEKKLDLLPVSSSIPGSLSFLGQGQEVKYCTELNFFQRGIVFGPGDIKNAHTPNEKIAKRELQQAVKIYRKILEEYKR